MQAAFPFAGYTQPPAVYRNVAATVLRYVPPGSRIFDFGSGPCDKTSVLQNLGYMCTAYDDFQDDWHRNDNNMHQIRDFAHASGVTLLTNDEVALSSISDQFDVVMSLEVLEHLHNSPRELLVHLVRLIRPGGYLLITVPNLANLRKRIDLLRGHSILPPYSKYYWSSGEWRGHIREYTRNDLEQLSDFLELSVIELRSCHQMLERLPRIARTPYVQATRLFPGLRDTWLLLAQKNSIIATE